MQAALVLAESRGLLSRALDAGQRMVGGLRPRGLALLGRQVDAPSDDFIMRNSGDAEQIAIGWWPSDRNRDRAAFFAFAYPAPDGFADADLNPEAARWDTDLGEFVLDWEDIRSAKDPQALALEFARSALAHGCEVYEWDPALAASAQGNPPPVS